MLWIVLAVLAVVVVGAVLIYNSLVALRNRAAAAWSDIDVQLKRRHDLVGNLVETVKGYARTSARRSQVTEARTTAEAASGSGDPRAAGPAAFWSRFPVDDQVCRSRLKSPAARHRFHARSTR